MSDDDINDSERVLKLLIERYPNFSQYYKICHGELNLPDHQATKCLAILSDHKLITTQEPWSGLMLARANQNGMSCMKINKTLKGYLNNEQRHTKWQRSLVGFRYFTYWPLVVITILSLPIATSSAFNQEEDSIGSSKYSEDLLQSPELPVQTEERIEQGTEDQTDSVGNSSHTTP